MGRQSRSETESGHGPAQPPATGGWRPQAATGTAEHDRRSAGSFDSFLKNETYAHQMWPGSSAPGHAPRETHTRAHKQETARDGSSQLPYSLETSLLHRGRLDTRCPGDRETHVSHVPQVTPTTLKDLTTICSAKRPQACEAASPVVLCTPHSQDDTILATGGRSRVARGP